MTPERLGDADREAVAAALGRHYTEGRIDTDELSRRLDLAYADDAAGALADLPPLAAAAPPQRRRWWGARHGESDQPQPGWLPTTERFVDPTTSRVMRVWVDPADGARHYVAEAAS